MQDYLKNTHQNASFVNAFKKFLHQNYPIASVYLKLFFYIKNSNLKKNYIENGTF